MFMYQYLLRYSGEVGTKGSSTRWSFIKRLANNIKRVVAQAYPGMPKEELKVLAHWDNIRVSCREELNGFLQRIQGISNFSRVEEMPYKGYEHLKQRAAEFFQDRIGDRTFAVRCKKMGRQKYDFSKLDLERDVGTLLEGNVNLSDPEYTCHIVLDQDKVYLHHETIPGAEGLPVGTQGKALCMYSGGIDSPVAAWHGFRAGVYQHFVYFDLGGGEQKQLMFRSLERLYRQWGSGSKSRLIYLDFNPIVEEILKADRKYHNLILKYFFYKTSDKLADILHCDAIITGESLGQVSTQTLKNLSALDRLTDRLIVRPLSTLNKLDIIKQAKAIGTYDLAYTGKEYCALATHGVVTASTHQRLMAAVEGLDETLMDKAIQGLSEYKLWNESLPLGGVETRIPTEADIIDLRNPEQFKLDGFPDARQVSFAEAWNDFVHWDRSKQYFLVCDVGAQSIVLSEYMKREGFQVEHLEGGMRAYSKTQTASQV